MKSILIRLGLTALMIGALAGCGSGSNGSNGTNGTNGANGANGTNGTNGTNAGTIKNVAQLSAADFQALKPVVTVQSVTIGGASSVASSGVSGAPVVKFKIIDQSGIALTGFGGQSNNPAQTNLTHVSANYNISFTLDKLIPASSSAPSYWVNMLVSSLASTSTPASAVTVNGGVSWTAGRPSSDSNGTLIDNGDGTYQYTFLRDVTQTQAIINALPTSYVVSGVTYNTADLDPSHLNYDPTATHRLGVILSGSQPGTGTSIPSGVQPTGTIPVPLVYTFNSAYDFVPNGTPVVNTRNIVTAGSCDGCHDNVAQKRGIGHVSTASASNGVPPGAYVGRNDPQLCLTCHTDQMKFENTAVTVTTNADGSPAYSGSYTRTNLSVTGLDQAAFTFPRMIHQTHMGNKLVYTGYNLAGNCSGDSLTTGGAQCLNQVGLPLDQRSCTKCHDGNATKSDGSTNVNKTSEGNNWMSNPSRIACGACHDGINFATGTGITLGNKEADEAAGRAIGTTATGHIGGPKADDSLCSLCHTPATIPTYHAVTTTSLNSVGLQSGVDTVVYNISSVSLNSSGNPVITFQIKVNGTTATKLTPTQTFKNATTGQLVVDPNVASLTQFPELAGNIPLLGAFAVPQDGITAPTDFNAKYQVSLANILIPSGSPKQGYLDPVNNPLSGGVYIADANGNFTATLTGDTIGQTVGAGCTKPVAPAVASCVNTAVLPSPTVVPSNAVMLTGALAYSFIQTNLPAYPYTKANVTVNPAVNVASVQENVGTGLGGLVISPKQSIKAASGGNTIPGGTGTTARRIVTSVALCNNCHDQLGTNPQFHSINTGEGLLGAIAGAGERNDPNVCAFCHTGNQADGSGFAANISTWVHAIHGSPKRTVPFTAHNTDFSTILYPGQLKDCNQCHLPNTVNFGNGSSAQGGGLTGGTLQANLLWTYDAAGTMAANSTYLNPVTSLISELPTSNIGKSPWVNVGQNYGNVFKFVGAGATLATYTTSAGNNTGGIGAAAASAVPAQVAPTGGLIVPADNATLVSSPITAACSACHTDQVALNHMTSNGGAFYAKRASVDDGKGNVVKSEGCLACHGQGTLMDTAVVHQTQ